LVGGVFLPQSVLWREDPREIDGVVWTGGLEKTIS